jgi:hypothetical protein
MCGGLGGGLLASGLFLGGKNPARQRGDIQRAAGDFMDRFRNRFGSSCCRILSKRGSDKAKSRFAHCSDGYGPHGLLIVFSDTYLRSIISGRE